MKPARRLWPLLLAAGAILTPVAAHADDIYFFAGFAWTAEVQSTTFAPGHVVRIGTMRGMFDDPDQGPLNGLAMACPFLESAEAKSPRLVSFVAYCTIGDDAAGKAFVNFGCAGSRYITGCEGNFEFTGGTGRFAGIVGRGSVIANTFEVAADGTATTGLAEFDGFYNGVGPPP